MKDFVPAPDKQFERFWRSLPKDQGHDPLSYKNFVYSLWQLTRSLRLRVMKKKKMGLKKHGLT